MVRKYSLLCLVVGCTLFFRPSYAEALSAERWTNAEDYGVFFNNYEPNFYTGFAPRVQDRQRVTFYIGRGNQVRVRLVLPEATIENYIPDQVSRHDLYQELIEKSIIKLTTNREWEAYQARFQEEDLAKLARKRAVLSKEDWLRLNLEVMERLAPGRLEHISRDFNDMASGFIRVFREGGEFKTLADKLEAVNGLFPHRILVSELTQQQEEAFLNLARLAGENEAAKMTAEVMAFFHDITGHIYPIRHGRLDYYEINTVYPVGTYDTTTTYKGQRIPEFTTTGLWRLIPRKHGKGMVGMVDYISSQGYYGLMPMLPYQYAGGIAYNAFHNPGISNWLAGHPLLPVEWQKMTKGSRDGKPFLRLSITSRGPVSHGCTRLNAGHMTELREMLPSTSEGMEGVRAYFNLSHCYDIIDLRGDGREQAMGVQYYIAFRHTESRVANQIWCQNNREDFYRWLYGNEINYGPVGQVTVTEAYDCVFVGRKAAQGKRYENVPLYEAPYEPEHLQFYVINNIDTLSREGMEFNRELRRVGHGYDIDRGKLFLKD
jgi:hypothetical protein